MSKREIAATLFDNHACSQAVLLTFAREFGVDEKTANKIAYPFGGGMGRLQLTCGAVTGAFMVLGLKYGTSPEAKDHVYNMVKKFNTLFLQKHSSTQCRELLSGYDLNSPEDKEILIAKNMFKTHCEEYVKDAVEILEKLFSEE